MQLTDICSKKVVTSSNNYVFLLWYRLEDRKLAGVQVGE
jgi:hypothetical protein